jgi:hypothetical protein
VQRPRLSCPPGAHAARWLIPDLSTQLLPFFCAKTSRNNERTVGIALIETAAGIADAEAIMAVEGASVVEREASHAALQTTTVARGVNKPSRPSPSRYRCRCGCRARTCARQDRRGPSGSRLLL